MVQRFFPSLHETPIKFSRECSHELIARRSYARVTVSNIGKAAIRILGKLNLKPTSSHSRNDLQHLDRPSFGLVPRDIPNRFSEFVRRNENAIALSKAG